MVVSAKIAARTASSRSFVASLMESCGDELPAAFVLDVGLIEGRDWAVIEANPASSAGLYGCDPHKVLDVLAGACSAGQ